jgi:hypothetical protein
MHNIYIHTLSLQYTYIYTQTYTYVPTVAASEIDELARRVRAALDLIYTYAYMHNTHTHMHNTHTHMHNTHTHMHNTHTHTYIHTHTCTRTQQYMYIYIHTYTHTYAVAAPEIDELARRVRAALDRSDGAALLSDSHLLIPEIERMTERCVCMYVWTCVSMYVCMSERFAYCVSATFMCGCSHSTHTNAYMRAGSISCAITSPRSASSYTYTHTHMRRVNRLPSRAEQMHLEHAYMHAHTHTHTHMRRVGRLLSTADQVPLAIHACTHIYTHTHAQGQSPAITSRTNAS